MVNGILMTSQLKIRLPSDAKAFVEDQARQDASSQNSVVVRAIRAAMKANGPAATAIAPDLEHDLPR